MTVEKLSRQPVKHPVETLSIVRVRYYDHVLFKNANPEIFKPTVREAVGFLNYENDLFLRLIVDIPYEKLPFEKPNQTSGLVILKKNIIERKEIE